MEWGLIEISLKWLLYIWDEIERLMKMFKIICGLIMAAIFSVALISCSGPILVTNKPHAVHKEQEAIAKEIISNYCTACNAALQLNDTNVVTTAAKIKKLTERLIKMSKKLDTTGPFAPDLRDATLEKLAAIDTIGESLPHPKSLQSQSIKDAEIMSSAMENYLSDWVSLMDKAGLVYEANDEASDTNASLHGTNKP